MTPLTSIVDPCQSRWKMSDGRNKTHWHISSCSLQMTAPGSLAECKQRTWPNMDMTIFDHFCHHGCSVTSPTEYSPYMVNDVPCNTLPLCLHSAVGLGAVIRDKQLTGTNVLVSVFFFWQVFSIVVCCDWHRSKFLDYMIDGRFHCGTFLLV